MRSKKVLYKYNDRRDEQRSPLLNISLLRRILRKSVGGLFAVMPGFIRFYFIRLLAVRPIDLPDNSEIKMAETREEYEQAFRIQYDQYVHLGYIDKNASEMTFNLFHSLPSTRVIIVKIADEVVATMSIFLDSSMGLPMEAAWDVSECRQGVGKIAEIGALCIKRGRPGLKGKLFLPMCIYMFRYSKYFLKLDRFVIATRREVKDFYQALFSFKLLKKSPFVNYENVKGRGSVGQFMDFNYFSRRAPMIYRFLPKKCNLLFLAENQIFPQMKFPKSPLEAMRSQKMQGPLEEYFFVNKLPLYSQIDTSLAVTMLNLKGPESEFAKVLVDSGRLELLEKTRLRESARFSVRFPAKLVSLQGGEFLHAVELFDVSGTGAMLFTPGVTLDEASYAIELEIPDFGHFKLQIDVAWLREGYAGVKLSAFGSHRWGQFLSYLAGSDSNLLDSRKTA